MDPSRNNNIEACYLEIWRFLRRKIAGRVERDFPSGVEQGVVKGRGPPSLNINL